RALVHFERLVTLTEIVEREGEQVVGGGVFRVGVGGFGGGDGGRRPFAFLVVVDGLAHGEERLAARTGPGRLRVLGDDAGEGRGFVGAVFAGRGRSHALIVLRLMICMRTIGAGALTRR